MDEAVSNAIRSGNLLQIAKQHQRAGNLPAMESAIAEWVALVDEDSSPYDKATAYDMLSVGPIFKVNGIRYNLAAPGRDFEGGIVKTEHWRIIVMENSAINFSSSSLIDLILEMPNLEARFHAYA